MTTEQKLIKAKLNLLELGSYLGNVSEGCFAYRQIRWAM